MTKIEMARKIVSQGGCSDIRCHECPLGPDPDHCGASRKGRQHVQYARDWLAKNYPAPIIGWPGNVEEMRQYEGQAVEFSDYYGFRPSCSGSLSIIAKNIDNPYKCGMGCGFAFCRPIHRPAFPELTLSDIADKFGIPLDQLRIKDGKR